MILHNLSIFGKNGSKQIHVEYGKIKAITDQASALKYSAEEVHLELEGALAFPGLINSHDHLEFNLYPRIGNRVYNNYSEWGPEIHEQNKDQINAILRVPENLRVRWGVYKNLLNGFTSVVNHGKKLAIRDELVSVHQPHSLHSPQFEKNWKWKLNAPLAKQPMVMHIGEGKDAKAEKEINQVIRWNIFKRKLIAVHGVAMNEKQARSFAGLVWCPASNYFLLNKTAAIDQVKGSTKVVFGTDSTLTSSWNCWEHIRLAKKTGMLKDEELMATLTTAPAELWGFGDRGTIEENKTADLVVARKKDDLFSLNPEDFLLILHEGQIRMWDKSLASQLNDLPGKGFGSIILNGSVKYVQGDLDGLIAAIKSYGVQTNL